MKIKTLSDYPLWYGRLLKHKRERELRAFLNRHKTPFLTAIQVTIILLLVGVAIFFILS